MAQTATKTLGEALQIGTRRIQMQPTVEHLAALIAHYRDLTAMNFAPVEFDDNDWRAMQAADARNREETFRRREEMEGRD